MLKGNETFEKRNFRGKKIHFKFNPPPDLKC